MRGSDAFRLGRKSRPAVGVTSCQRTTSGSTGWRRITSAAHQRACTSPMPATSAPSSSHRTAASRADPLISSRHRHSSEPKRAPSSASASASASAGRDDRMSTARSSTVGAGRSSPPRPCWRRQHIGASAFRTASAPEAERSAANSARARAAASWSATSGAGSRSGFRFRFRFRFSRFGFGGSPPPGRAFPDGAFSRKRLGGRPGRRVVGQVLERVGPSRLRGGFLGAVVHRDFRRDLPHTQSRGFAPVAPLSGPGAGGGGAGARSLSLRRPLRLRLASPAPCVAAATLLPHRRDRARVQLAAPALRVRQR